MGSSNAGSSGSGIGSRGAEKSADHTSDSQSPAAGSVSAVSIASVVLGVSGLLWLVLIITDPRVMFRLPRRSFLGGVGAVSFPWIGAIVVGVFALNHARDFGLGRRSARMAKTGIWLGVIPMIFGVAYWWTALMNREPPCLRGRVSRVKSDMRALATAIEAYYVDHNIYPAWAVGDDGPGGTHSYNYRVAVSSGHPDADPARLPTFALNSAEPGQAFRTLTTPMAYITSYPSDPFSKVRGSTFVFWSVFPGDLYLAEKSGKSETAFGVGWILVSPGPDLVYDLPGNWDVYDPSIAQPSPRLLAGVNKRGRAFTYDPTNGTISAGDVWRVKQ